MTYLKFKKLVNDIVDCGFGGYQSQADDCMKLVRIKNKIGVYHLKEKVKLFARFEEMFNKEVVEGVVRKCEMTESSGLGFYSNKHDILIGGDPVFSQNSYFKLSAIP